MVSRSTLKYLNLKKLFLIFIFLFTLNASFSQSVKTLEFDRFSVDIPENWEVEGVSEEDSTAHIILAGSDTLLFDTSYVRNWFRPFEFRELDTLGEYSIPEGVDSSFAKLLQEANSKTKQNNDIIKNKNQHWKRANELLRETHPFSFNHDFVDVQKVLYKATLITPKGAKGTTTGVYIELKGSGKRVFYLRGKNLSPVTKNQVLQVSETVKGQL